MRSESLSDEVTIYNADCREVLPRLAKCDAVVTDPPYGIGKASSRAYSTLAKARDFGTNEWDGKRLGEAIIQVALHGVTPASGAIDD